LRSCSAWSSCKRRAFAGVGSRRTRSRTLRVCSAHARRCCARLIRAAQTSFSSSSANPTTPLRLAVRCPPGDETNVRERLVPGLSQVRGL
jgi:hypothetical protein